MIKPTPLVTGPLDVARLGTNIQSVLQYFDVGECPRSFFPRAPGLEKAIEVAISRRILPDVSPKADGIDEIEYRCRK